MSELAMPSMPEKESPTSRVCVSKDEAAKMKVGSSVSLSLSGEVKSLHPSYDNKEQYEVEISNPVVEVESDETEEDTNPATMPREKLKAKIKKDSSKPEE